MAKYRVTSPDGQAYDVTAPDSATPEEVQAFAMKTFGAGGAAGGSGGAGATAKPPAPTGSAMQNFAAGMGAKITDLGLGLKQRFAEAANAMEGSGDNPIRKLFGMQSAPEDLAAVQQQVAEKRQLDAPLMATTGGKVGAIAGAAVPAIAAAMIPGAQGLAGSIATGAAMGGAEPTTPDESALRNAAFGGAAGAAGYGAGKLIGAGIDKLAANRAAQQAANVVKDIAGEEAKAAGYVIPPTQTNPSTVNKALEGLAGKISTGQAASVKNQPVTNSLARQALGLPEDAPLTLDTLKAVRQQAGQAYDAIRNLGQVTSDAKYTNDLLSIGSAGQNAAANFPGLAKNEINDVVASLNQKTFDSSGAVDAIRILRDKADTAFGSGDKSLGRAFRAASDALEGMLDRAAQAQAAGNPQMSAALQEFQNARQLIAKTYSVEKALNPATGNVSATKLGAQLARQKPLSGELETAAKMGLSFPKAAQDVSSSIPGISPLDYMGAAGISAATSNPAMMALAAGRPLARSLILSRPYQAAIGGPSYGSIADLLGTPQGQNLIRIGALVSPQALEQK